MKEHGVLRCELQDLNQGTLGRIWQQGLIQQIELTIPNNNLNPLLFITKAFLQVLFFTMPSYYDYDYNDYYSSHSSCPRKSFWMCHSLIQNPSTGNSSLRAKSKFLNITLESQLARHSKALWICSHHCISPPQPSPQNASCQPLFLLSSCFYPFSMYCPSSSTSNFGIAYYFWFCDLEAYLN